MLVLNVTERNKFFVLFQEASIAYAHMTSFFANHVLVIAKCGLELGKLDIFFVLRYM